jgi:magnesium transporter
VSLESRLAHELIRIRPVRAAAALDRLSATDAAVVLNDVPPQRAARIFAHMSPHTAADVLERLDPEAAAGRIAELGQDVAARLTRRVTDACRAKIFAKLPARPKRTLETLLAFQENSAGALMDPEVLALVEVLTVREALERIREVPDQARYNVYVIDRSQVLVGVVNLRELLCAEPTRPLTEVMTTDPVRLESNVDRSVVISHPGWKRVHSIPVVDARGGYLGAVRYRTLRQLEAELLGAAHVDANAGEALGEVFAAGAAGLLDALSGGQGRVS